MTEQLTLVLTDFEGPLDLLLHLIKQTKIDIYDIPIAEITAQYLDYLHQMQVLKLDVAGDYLVMAATLMKIKSKLLLPKAPELIEEETEEYVDPRQELVDQLLAYQAFQKVATVLQERELERQQLFAKPASSNPAEKVVPLARGVIKPRDLAAAVSKMLVEAQTKQPVFKTVQNDEISITDKMSWIVRHLAAQPVAFEALVVVKTDRDEIVTTFLAVLELMKDRKIICEQADYDASIMVRLKEGISVESSR
ncbi:segregation and condensation protein A [Latilactobacillus curvatus]|uniref:segregation and condensation protein A n=1 Tax=Latilactobacillus curvatus TaxID=28038 RepID=UPI000B61EAE3|nr:segregation/condensation protein A [Latilactobacillus curvatus]ASN61845.1 segregation and condensation protein A [Latilactobacillus curvatus]AZP96316.1 segregation and condensation protein A [Latilactobacillus curvatus]MCT2880649.1 segregation and condensation protein A [Latilactobacillus curvatus]MED9786761.1 segregation/condensation protein A [Latilactobacillus curvatus]UTC08736.1 segregation and condensation protein A [Latilactobacillus curvatus]